MVPVAINIVQNDLLKAAACLWYWWPKECWSHGRPLQGATVLICGESLSET